MLGVPNAYCGSVARLGSYDYRETQGGFGMDRYQRQASCTTASFSLTLGVGFISFEGWSRVVFWKLWYQTATWIVTGNS